MPGIGQSLRYGLPGFTLAFAALPLYLLTPALYAQQFGLSLGLIGVLLMLTRLTDAIADPFIGRWIDQSTQSLWLWMAGGLIVMAVGLGLLTHPTVMLDATEPSVLKFSIWLVGCTLIVSLANSTATLAHQSWAVAWTAEIAGQSRLIGARELCGLVGVISAAAIAGQQSGGLLGLVAVISAIVAIAASFGLRLVGHRSSAGAARPPVAWSALLQQAKLRELLGTMGINALANAIPPTLILFFLQDYLGATPNQASGLLAAYFVAAATAVPFWSWAAHRFRAKTVWIIAMSIAVAAFGWTLTLDQSGLMAFAAICLITGAVLGAELVCPPILLGRRIDREGHRGTLEASYFGLWNLVIKLALALAAGLTLPILSGLDYQPGISSPDNNLSALQWAYAGIPIALKCIAIAALWRFHDESAPHPTLRSHG
jgi:Na+/melibiose symporter-like transporter